jgi:hypothetical protein
MQIATDKNTCTIHGLADDKPHLTLGMVSLGMLPTSSPPRVGFDTAYWNSRQNLTASLFTKSYTTMRNNFQARLYHL